MRIVIRVIKKYRALLLLLAIVLGGLALAGCQTGRGAIPRGWSGGAIDNGTLFIGSQTGELVAVDTADGRRIFSAALETEAPTSGILNCSPGSSAVAIYGSPSVGDDLVYVAGYNGKIYAYNRDEFRQEPRWIYPRQEDIGGAIVGGTVFDQGKIYFGADNHKIYALDATDGFKEWEFETGDTIWATPAIVGDTLYIGSFDKIFYALDTGDGRQRWQYETEGAIVSTPLVYENTVYFGSFDRHLYALNAADGSLKWKFASENWFWARPLAVNGAVYAAGLDGIVYVLDAATGNKRMEFDLGNPIASSPVLVDNMVIVATEAGVVYALDTTDNRQSRLANLEEHVAAPLAASQGKVYIHSSTGVLYEIEVQTGALREINISK